MRSNLKKRNFTLVIALLLCTILASCGGPGQKEKVYRGVTIAPSYGYYMSGRTDRVTGYVVKIDKIASLDNPGLVFLTSGIKHAGEAYVDVNGTQYDIPPLAGDFEEKSSEISSGISGKQGWYSFKSGDDLVGKIAIPLKKETLRDGINEVAFFTRPESDGFEVIDAQIENIDNIESIVIGQTYHLLARGRHATIRDFDYVHAYQGEKRRSEHDIPEWAQRGKVNFYRAGINWENLDRMFEMFKEARVNLVATGVPRDTKSEQYKRIKKFIDRCHENDIRVTAFNSLGGIDLREVLMDPDLKKWVYHDEVGNMRWRQSGKVFAADLANMGYRKHMLEHAKIQIDADVDELYYDFAIGGTGDVLDFFAEIREIARKKGKNISIYGNCKGNILVDEVCDLLKSEGTTEAGVWDGKWVHNIPQARFYFAAGSEVKPYRSKYEGADPGVANPGAHDVRDNMKFGWKKPIAEASAFQSHFAIAEAGSKLFNGWLHKDNPMAMQVWSDICRYYTFLDDNRDLYTDVQTFANIAILAPPLIPSFEVSLKRESLYNALAEMNIMYDVLLLHRLEEGMLNRYKAVIIADISWMGLRQFEAIQAYQKKGGKVYTIGSTNRLQKMADMVSSADVFAELNKMSARRTLSNRLRELEGLPIISLSGAKYVAANVAHKKGTDRYFLHFVNYDKPQRNIRVRVNLGDKVNNVTRDAIRLYSPDDVPLKLKSLSIKNGRIEFTLPVLDIYNVVEIGVGG